MAIIRPLEVLAEEWLALRKAGVKTPAIAAWPTAACGGAQVCMGTKADGNSYAMWRWVLDEFCELALLLPRPSSASCICCSPDSDVLLATSPKPSRGMAAHAALR